MELVKDRAFKEDIAAFAGRWLEYSIFLLQHGNTFIPMGISQKSSFWSGTAEDRHFFAMEQLEDGAQAAMHWLALQHHRERRAIVVIDGFITTAEGKRDALIATAIDYKKGNPVRVFLPYRPASDPLGLQTYEPIVELPDGARHADHIRSTLRKFLTPRTRF
ncbi:hypothetical protein [Methylovirgula sp. 4M-Z18]|uniref:hypothetical protein n=1 Tax=Methylovirgula sp. 4M-Z18 TaxID=2293567 RepID=UPI000E2FA2F3|nr:hypothetical protein [Methylovirgula sp. 4M-Z18]RFB78371.1 hypothetical protein DYH55_16640 [Methylovirgula sp. 4M-Z18]